MELYPALLWLHSWNRWLIVVLGLVVLVRSLTAWAQHSEWTVFDQRAGLALMISADLQLLMGLVFFAVSPVIQSALNDMHLAMSIGALRFFTVEHPTMMLLAIIAIHLGRIKGRKSSTARQHHATSVVALLIASVLIAASIPWPSKTYGRPLFRLDSQRSRLTSPVAAN